MIARVTAGLFGLLLAAAPVLAQSQDCSVLTQQALAASSQFCSSLGRNQVCYGNNQIEASGWDGVALPEFSEPGNLASVFDLSQLVTAPLDTVSNTWGVAVLSLQANLPETLPGQNVTFVVFGNTQLDNAVTPEAAVTPVTLYGTSLGRPNVRETPATNRLGIGQLRSGDRVLVVGRNAAGDWLQFVYLNSKRWVSADYIRLDGDKSTLPVVSRADAEDSALTYTAPMQAFRVSTQPGQVNCEEVPQDGLMIQAPGQTTVNLKINDVEVSIGSTALLRLMEDDNTLRLATLDGHVGLKSNSDLTVLESGNAVNIGADQSVSEPERYLYDDVRALPLGLLPESFTLLPPQGTELSVFVCHWGGGVLSALLPADKPLVFAEALGAGNAAVAERLKNTSTVTLTMDGEALPLWGISDPYQSTVSRRAEDGGSRGTSTLYDWWFVVPHPQPGTYHLHLRWVAEQEYDYDCQITVVAEE